MGVVDWCANGHGEGERAGGHKAAGGGVVGVGARARCTKGVGPRDVDREVGDGDRLVGRDAELRVGVVGAGAVVERNRKVGGTADVDGDPNPSREANLGDADLAGGDGRLGVPHAGADGGEAGVDGVADVLPRLGGSASDEEKEESAHVKLTLRLMKQSFCALRSFDFLLRREESK